MPTVDTKDAKGAKAGTVELDDAVFGIQPNVPVMHQVVTAQLAARRSGTQSTKTRAEVRGGGAKPWKQKGTGRARAGSTRAPHWVGGGVTHAPKPRDYSQRTPKKMIRLALKSALSDRAASERVLVLDWGLDTPSTKGALADLARSEERRGGHKRENLKLGAKRSTKKVAGKVTGKISETVRPADLNHRSCCTNHSDMANTHSDSHPLVIGTEECLPLI